MVSCLSALDAAEESTPADWEVGRPHSFGLTTAVTTCSSTWTYAVSTSNGLWCDSTCCDVGASAALSAAAFAAAAVVAAAALWVLCLGLTSPGKVFAAKGGSHAAQAPNSTSVSTAATAAVLHCHSPAAGVGAA